MLNNENQVRDANIPQPVLAIVPNEGLKVGFNNVSFGIDFDWKDVLQNGVRNTLASSGRFTIMATKVDVDFRIQFYDGKPDVKCTAVINDLKPLSGNLAFY